MRGIWQRADWPNFIWDAETILPFISKARFEQGKLLSKVNSLGFELGHEASSSVLIEEVLKTSEIEGEQLNHDLVRSSVVKRLGIPDFGLPLTTRSIDGLVEVLIDGTTKHQEPLTVERLQSWQAALFPGGYSGLLRIEVGKFRSSEDPMRVVSGGMGREILHFEAIPSKSLQKEMDKFLNWWNFSFEKIDGLIRAGIAHFYFVTIHPFEDGNGRIARALTDVALAQDEKISTRFYSLSSQIMKQRRQYYEVLERCQRGGLDVTSWLTWFLTCYIRSLEGALILIAKVLDKSNFWHHFRQVSFNDRQRKVINLLLSAGKEEFLGGLTTRKYSSISKVSRATAFREISDLLEKRVIIQNPTKGRSTSYDLNWDICK